MRASEVSALVLAVAASLPCRADDKAAEKPESALPALGAGLSPAALVGAGLAAAALVAAGAGGGGGDGEASPSGNTSADTSGNTNGASGPSRTLAYSGAADFRTSEFGAQTGLAMVKAESLYYNGHYRWYVGEAASAAAGTGIGVRIAVGDTGINAAEAATGSSIAIDAAASYDYVAHRAGSGADELGHGTHVAGLIAAPRNGAGMHGLAYNATLVNFKLADGSGLITASDAERGDMMARAAAAGAWILNNSWATAVPITTRSAEELQQLMPRLIEGSRAYVGGGGVVVFAAGNAADAQPALEPGLPYRVAGLAPGWLAVVAVDGSGAIASYSNRCGVAAAWCLAAPGGSPGAGLYSMQNNGGYASLYGTSMAAPHAAAAIGALKSMFPNLSYVQLRERLLFTANRSGRYADAQTYGQGLMDLAAASAPVGGVAVPTQGSANGATAPVAESGIEFQAGTLAALGMQPWVLVVDNYQRAPFWMPAQAFFREARPRLLERHFASLGTPLRGTPERRGVLRFSHSSQTSAVSADLAGERFGFSSGAGGEAVLASHLQLAHVPRLAAPAVDSLALGYGADLGRLRLGLFGTLPGLHENEASAARTLEGSPLGSRRALGFVAQSRAGSTTYGFSAAFADAFERPIGLATSGAFAIDASSALSTGTFVQHALDASTLVEASLESAYHRPEAHGALAAPGYALHSAELGARTALGARTTVSAGLKREWTGAQAARLSVPATIDENGALGRVTYRLPYDELVGRSALTLRFDHALTRHADLRAGLVRERNGFGDYATGIAVMVEIEN